MAVATFWGLSELEVIGLAALIYLTSHLFVSFVWPSLRSCACIVWSDLVAAAHRVKHDWRELRR